MAAHLENKEFVFLHSFCISLHQCGDERIVLLIPTGGVWCGCSEKISGLSSGREEHSVASACESQQPQAELQAGGSMSEKLPDGKGPGGADPP